MAFKEVDLPEVGKVKIYKKSGVRSMRVTLHPDHYVRVTIPKWVPYKAGLDFVKAKSDWIAKHRPDERILFSGQLIGKRHRLVFEPKSFQKINSRITDFQVKVHYPAAFEPDDREVQQAAKAACIRALRREAKAQLPARLSQLSRQTGLSCNSASVRQLKARWGSCSPSKDITLSIFLMQLPWELIDYVILHELIHTKFLSHGPDFWGEFSRHISEPKQYRKKLRAYRPALHADVA